MTRAKTNTILRELTRLGINKTKTVEPKTATDIMQEKGKRYLENLIIFKPYIRSFNTKARKVCFFENYAGFWDYQEPEIIAKRKELEADGNHMVYAITHEAIDDCEMWTFLLVSKNDEDLTYTGNGIFEAFAYSWNKTCDWCSEYGFVSVRSFGGGIKRIY